MNKTGVTRKIDELGRIVIPKEIRKNFNIRDGETLEIFIDEEGILLKKYFEINNNIKIGSKLCEIIKNIYDIEVFITDREKVVISSIDEIINKKLDDKLITYIDERMVYESNDMIDIDFEGITLNGFFTIVPIIVDSNSVGLVIFYNKKLQSLLNLGKLVATILENKININ